MSSPASWFGFWGARGDKFQFIICVFIVLHIVISFCIVLIFNIGKKIGDLSGLRAGRLGKPDGKKIC